VGLHSTRANPSLLHKGSKPTLHKDSKPTLHKATLHKRIKVNNPTTRRGTLDNLPTKVKDKAKGIILEYNHNDPSDIRLRKFYIHPDVNRHR
jgi:hypothetical protein